MMTQDILITPSSGQPQILFRGSGTNDTPITLNVWSSYASANGSGSALIFQGEEGQLFSITDNMSSGTIFSVADQAGLPLIEADASGDVQLIEFGRYVGIGTGTPQYQLDVFGTGRFSEGIIFPDGNIQTTAYTGVGGGGGAGASYTYMIPIWAEENSTLGNSTYEWAFGNGANTPNDGGIMVYVPAGETCRVVAMSYVNQNNASTVDINLVVNGTPQGASARVQATSARTAINTGINLSISNGDIINFFTSSASNTSGPCTVTAFLEYSSTTT